MNKADTLQTIELSEGVEIHLRVAGPVPRALAYMIDLLHIILYYIIYAFAMAFAVLPTLGPQVFGGLMLLFIFFMNWFYFAFYEAGKRGATPGKRRMGLRVARPSGAPASLSQAIVRNFLRTIDFLPMAYGVGLVTCLCTKRFQRLGDLAADTVVVYAAPERGIAALSFAPVSGMEGAGRAPGFALNREEQLALALFAERVPRLSPARREELAAHATELTSATGPEAVRDLVGMARWIQESKAR